MMAMAFEGAEGPSTSFTKGCLTRSFCWAASKAACLRSQDVLISFHSWAASASTLSQSPDLSEAALASNSLAQPIQIERCVSSCFLTNAENCCHFERIRGGSLFSLVICGSWITKLILSLRLWARQV